VTDELVCAKLDGHVDVDRTPSAVFHSIEQETEGQILYSVYMDIRSVNVTDKDRPQGDTCI